VDVKLDVLNKGEIENIYEAALHVMERTGAVIASPAAVEILRKAGARVEDATRVFIPRRLVEQALSYAPAKIPIYDRLGNQVMLLGDKQSYFGAHQGCPTNLDSTSGERHPTTLEYCAKSTRVIDALPNVDWVTAADYVSDALPAYADAALFATTLRNTSKPLIFSILSLETGMMIVEMAAAAVGGLQDLRAKPFTIFCDSSVAPLYHPTEPVEKLLFAAEKGLPCNYNPMPQGGLTAPVTMAGVLVVTLAELLTSLAFIELAYPGTPYTCGGVPSMFDMRDAAFVYGSPELFLMCSALTDIVHYYHLPSLGTAGMTNSKTVDLQAAVDSSLSSLMALLSRSNLIHDVGIIEAGVHSLPMVVLTDEIIGMLRRMEHGIEVTPETLAVDVIDKVGPQGTFIAEEHTRRHFRECWYPTVFDHRPRAGEQNGIQIADALQKRIDEILATHRPAPLPAEAEAVIRRHAGCWTAEGKRR
jgi:trimethylamine---corrinoid protein Co-methyltransferase